MAEAKSGLAAVEEAGGEEDDGDHKGQTSVQQVSHAEADEGVYEPRGEAYEPYPSCLSHHHSCSRRKVAARGTGADSVALFYTKYLRLT